MRKGLVAVLVLLYRRHLSLFGLGARATRGPVALCILLISTSTVLSSSVEASIYSPRGTILVDGNPGFTSANGVTVGSGTESDPYIIEGWEINASSSDGIAVRNTDAHFVVRNVFVHSGGGIYPHGHRAIYFETVSNARIEDSAISTSISGLDIRGSNNVVVSGISFDRSFLLIVSSSAISVVDSSFYGRIFGVDTELVLSDVTDFLIEGNMFDGTRIDCDEDFVSGSIIGNNVTNSQFGIHLDECSGSLVIARNNLVDSAMENSYSGSDLRVKVFHNNFINSSITEQFSVEVSLSAWDDGYPSGGNFWSDYTGVDDCSGPDQDVCPDPDGVGDTPRIVENTAVGHDQNSVDRYPLMRPFAPSLVAEVDFDPDIIVSRNMGRYLTAYIELARPYDTARIDLSSIRLNHTVALAPGTPVTYGDHDHDSMSDLMVKFRLSDVKPLFLRPGTYTLEISGNVVGSPITPFNGFETIRVLSK